MIYNGLGSIETITGDFVGNYTKVSNVELIGGIIYNIGGSIESIIGDFVGNYAQGTNSGVQGGVIYNSGSDASVNITDSSFTGNYAILNTGTAKGGVIYNNSGTVNITDSSFTGNYAISTNSTADGGVIYNNSGTVQIVASGSDVAFTGNYAVSSGVSKANDIYNAGTVNLNAAANKTITFNGTVTGNNGSGTINVNDSAKNVNVDGKVQFNNTVTDNKIIQKSGTLELNNAGAENITVTAADGTTTVYNGDYMTAKSNPTTWESILSALRAGGTYTVTSTDGNKYNGTDAAFIKTLGGDLVVDGSVISGNKNGAVYVSGSDSTAVIENNSLFANNTTASSNNKGAAIYLDDSAEITSINATFIGNYISRNNSSSAMGGAIYTEDANIGDITGDFIGNYISSTKSGSTSGGQAFAGAIRATGNIGDITGDFIGNYVYSTEESQGGAIKLSLDSEIGTINSNIVGNYARALSGGAFGGFLFNFGTIEKIGGTGKVISGNWAQAYKAV